MVQHHIKPADEAGTRNTSAAAGGMASMPSAGSSSACPSARNSAARVADVPARASGPRLEVVRTPAGVSAVAHARPAAAPATGTDTDTDPDTTHTPHTTTQAIEQIVPGRPLPPLRVLRVPRCEPADEPEYVPVGATVIPFPERPQVWQPPSLRLVGAPDRVTPHEPDPAEARRQVRRFAVALVEVLSGARPLRQLGDHVTPKVRDRVGELRRELRKRKVTGVLLVASSATAPTDDTAEGFLRLRLAGPDRFEAVALRLDRRTPHARPHHPPVWVCTALHHR